MERIPTAAKMVSRWLVPLAVVAAAYAAPVQDAARSAAGSGSDPAVLMLGGTSLIVLSCLGRRSRELSVKGRSTKP
jgi:hypothetical protein